MSRDRQKKTSRNDMQGEIAGNMLVFLPDYYFVFLFFLSFFGSYVKFPMLKFLKPIINKRSFCKPFDNHKEESIISQTDKQGVKAYYIESVKHTEMS